MEVKSFIKVKSVFLPFQEPATSGSSFSLFSQPEHHAALAISCHEARLKSPSCRHHGIISESCLFANPTSPQQRPHFLSWFSAYVTLGQERPHLFGLSSTWGLRVRFSLTLSFKNADAPFSTGAATVHRVFLPHLCDTHSGHSCF